MQESQVTRVSWSYIRQKSEVELEVEDAWPELGPSIQINRPQDVEGSINVETSCSRSGRRFRRPEKISINLQEALKESRCIKRINIKRPMKVKMNICKSGAEITINKLSDRRKKLNVTKMIFCTSKARGLTPLKRIILLERDAKAHINIGKRELFEYQKMEASTRDVNSIDFGSLKITADPQIDSDYVRRMSELTFYGTDYRTLNEQNILDSLVLQKSDILAGFNNLHIGRKMQRNNMIGFDRNCAEETKNVLENEILPSTVSLRIDDNIKQEVVEWPELKQQNMLRFSKNFRE
ncbi:hypothetical protein KM043_006739 [Ampulex compressa]|nr:hypothetical protein KM043_006739 [Ampulex compressa]